VPPFPQTTLGGGVGRLHYEGMREEVHRFDRYIISEICSVHRHFFAEQACVMRKAGSYREIRLNWNAGRGRRNAQTKAPAREEAGADKMSKYGCVVSR
jgi:hypothetical protein